MGEWLQSTGSLLAVGLAMLAPFVVLALQRREANLLALAGLPLATFLLLSPAYGMQYLTWALAAVYLLDLRLATLVNAGGQPLRASSSTTRGTTPDRGAGTSPLLPRSTCRRCC